MEIKGGGITTTIDHGMLILFSIVLHKEKYVSDQCFEDTHTAAVPYLRDSGEHFMLYISFPINAQNRSDKPNLSNFSTN